MRISCIGIENFRSIKSLTFEPRQLSVLIGQNNAGKSNILRALNLALGETWPSERSFDAADFYNRDTGNPIVIKVIFDEVQTIWRNKSRCDIAGFQLRCRVYKRKTATKLAGDLAVDYTCINPKGAEITYPEEALQKGVAYKGRWLPLRVTSELRDKVPFIYIDVQRDYRRHSPGSRWAVLRRLFSDAQTKLSTDKTKVSDPDGEGGEIERTRLGAYEYRLKRAFDALRSADFEQIEETLERHAMTLLGFDPETDEVRLGFDPLDPENVFRTLQLYVREGVIESPAEDVGAGLQSAIVVAIFRTYQELQRQGAIFAVEEPEVFLHPHRARFFASTLCALADDGSQVFVSTHSPLFVPLDRYEDVALVRKTAAAGTHVVQTGALKLEAGSKEYLRLITECDSQRGEMFFASRVVLVEGYTERVALPLIFKAKGVDINRESISVVECQGKTKIPLFAKILSAFQIPFVVMHDEDVVALDPNWATDRQENARKRNAEHRQWNQAISEAVRDGSRVFVLAPTLEGICGLPAREDTKLQRAIETFSASAYEAVPEPLQKVVEATLALPV
jgi:predicted ATPase